MKVSILSKYLLVGHDGQACESLVQFHEHKEGGKQSNLKDPQPDHGYQHTYIIQPP